VTGKVAKVVHQQQILVIIEQLQKADPVITLFRFYTMDKNTPEWLCPLLQGKQIRLPLDPAGMKQ